MSKKNKNQVETTENKIVENNENQEAVPEKKEETKKMTIKEKIGLGAGITGGLMVVAYGVMKKLSKIHNMEDPMEGIADLGDDDDDLVEEVKTE